MRVPPFGVLLLLAITPLVTTATVVHVPVEQHVDPHGTCTGAVGSCWDLEGEDLGTNPVTDMTPPVPEGELVREEGNEHVHVRAKLLGRPIHLHGIVTWELAAAWNSTEHDGSGGHEESRVPCSDPRGCPDLLTDGSVIGTTAILRQETFEEGDCAIVEGSVGGPGERTLLRFAFRSPNLGSGDLVIGNPDDHPEWFHFDTCHGHRHFREYADYRLWTLEGYAAWRTLRTSYPHATPGEVMEVFPELRDHFVAGHKQGFCVIDVVPAPVDRLIIPGEHEKYTDCDDNQGISRFWADEYHRGLPGQYIDVTGVSSGPYVLETEVNPERLYVEEWYGNNDAAFVVHLP